jgi:hypothetical protein
MAAQNPALRREVISIYKGVHFISLLSFLSSPTIITALTITLLSLTSELLHLGKNYPLGYAYFRSRLHAAFAGNSSVTDEAEIRRGIEKAEFVKQGMSSSSFMLGAGGANQTRRVMHSTYRYYMIRDHRSSG